MMSRVGINLNVVCNTEETLKKIRENRDKHSSLVKEARAGYIETAKKQLEKRLAQLKEGKLVSVSFSLQPPQDYTTVYDTVINMLAAHTEPNITISASEFRQIVEDEWDWMSNFLLSNSGYSSGTRSYALSKGVSVDDESVGSAY